MKYQWKRIAAGIAAAGIIVTGTAACSHVQPSLGEYAVTTGHGALSAQQVVMVTQPGQKSYLGNGTTTWYFPANVRNYVTGPDGDRRTPTAEFTASGGPKNPAISAYVYTFVAWEVNPAIARRTGNWSLASHFLQFCLKYACASQSSQNDTSNASLERSSGAGWLNMTDEIFPRAIDNATRTALLNFPPSIWTSAGEAQWAKLADEIAANLPGELEALDGSKAEGQADYFCGPGSTMTNCAPFMVQVNPVTPTDPGVIAAYQQEQQANYALSAATARTALARELYGPDAGFFLGVRDTISACQASKVQCTIYLGSPPIHP